MYSGKDTARSGQWVSPFGNLRINAYLQLPEAYRCSSRPSSAPSAKASTVRSYSLNLIDVLSFSLHYPVFKERECSHTQNQTNNQSA
jgi:hypothetical protein